jgi:hypothetical protein
MSLWFESTEQIENETYRKPMSYIDEQPQHGHNGDAMALKPISVLHEMACAEVDRLRLALSESSKRAAGEREKELIRLATEALLVATAALGVWGDKLAPGTLEDFRCKERAFLRYALKESDEP